MDTTSFTPLGGTPTFAPIPPFAERDASFSEYAEAEIGNVIREGPTSSFVRGVELTAAEHGVGKYGRCPGNYQPPAQKIICGASASRERTIYAP